MVKKLNKKPAKSWLAPSLSSLQFSATFGKEIVNVVENMHGNIAGTANKQRPTRGITRFVYGCVRAGFSANEKVWQTLAALAEQTGDGATKDATSLAALNGVFGDMLQRSTNHLQIPMTFVDFEQHTLSKRSTATIFIHGLCMNEKGWAGEHHHAFTTYLEDGVDSDVIYLRYNSGLSIEQNGAAFAAQLATLSVRYQRILLVGHSMGGLVAASAMQNDGGPWLDKVSHLITLGSPHQGAPLERAGKFANGLLYVSRYSAPLAKLGDMRSQGIHDLHDGKPDILSLPAHIDCLLVAASRSEVMPENEAKAKHDLLVTVPSALARDKLGDAANVERQVFANMDHMQLLSDARVYTALTKWLTPVAE